MIKDDLYKSWEPADDVEQLHEDTGEYVRVCFLPSVRRSWSDFINGLLQFASGIKQDPKSCAAAEEPREASIQVAGACPRPSNPSKRRLRANIVTSMWQLSHPTYT